MNFSEPLRPTDERWLTSAGLAAARRRKGVFVMPEPVVHFEVIGSNPDRLRDYYGELFGWTFDTPSPVAKEVSDPDSYGFVDLVTAGDGTGIRGGIGGGAGYDSHAVFYVAVHDVEAALEHAERLGGTRVMGPATSPNGLVVSHFKDPEGTLIGVAGVG
jgi:predicted enzyme related to lactoylglutathione lyase